MDVSANVPATVEGSKNDEAAGVPTIETPSGSEAARGWAKEAGNVIETGSSSRDEARDDGSSSHGVDPAQPTGRCEVPA